MTTLRRSSVLLLAGALFAHATPASATDKADCTAAQKAAQADKTAGKLTKALTELATCSRPVCPKAMQKQCTDLATAVTASQPSVVFTAKDAGGNAVTDVNVTVDGVIMASGLDGTPVTLDPGTHAVKYESEGATPVEKSITVEPETKSQPFSVDLDKKPPAAATDATPAATTPAAKAPDDGPGSMYDVSEEPTKRYYFIGLRYRGDVIPKFMINIFVNGGSTLYSNAVSAEIDLRHDHFSLIPAITYADYGASNLLFEQDNSSTHTTATDPGNWSVVNSSMKAIYLSADLLWSVHLAPNWDFEYGAEFGLGFIFGALGDNWVTPQDKTNTQISPTNFMPCATIKSGAGCSPMDHNNATTNQVGGYEQPSWANGGSKPNIFPMINFPQVGIRYKPIKQMEARFGLGFSLTGFWFGISADYGLESPTK